MKTTAREARTVLVLWLLLASMLGAGLALAHAGGGANPKMSADFSFPTGHVKAK